MARLTMAQTYAYARQAGFTPSQAVMISAIAKGESGLRTDAKGDVSLQNSTWGPSVGLTQVRTLKAQTGTGKDRDIEVLTDPLRNMQAAYAISGHGTNWKPWTVYNTGKYRQFLGEAQSAAGSGVTVPDGGGSGGSGGSAGGGSGGTTGQPVGFLPDVGDTVKRVVFTGLFLSLGAALIVVGAVKATGAGTAVKKVAGTAAKLV